MLRQISIAEAAARMEAGETINCLIKGMVGSGWGGMVTATLNEYLADVVCFASDEAEEEPPKPRTQKKEIDTGKIKALYDAGWSVARIADELGVSAPTIRSRLSEMNEENKERS